MNVVSSSTKKDGMMIKLKLIFSLMVLFTWKMERGGGLKMLYAGRIVCFYNVDWSIHSAQSLTPNQFIQRCDSDLPNNR